MFNKEKSGNKFDRLEKIIDELCKRISSLELIKNWHKQEINILLEYITKIEAREYLIRKCPCCNRPMKVNVDFGTSQEPEINFQSSSCRSYTDVIDHIDFFLSCENKNCIGKPKTPKCDSLERLINKWNSLKDGEVE